MFSFHTSGGPNLLHFVLFIAHSFYPSFIIIRSSNILYTLNTAITTTMTKPSTTDNKNSLPVK